MKKLSDFKDEKGIEIAARILAIIMEILAKPANAAQEHAESPLAMFSAFMANSPAEMMRIFAVLSEADEATYTCNGAEALTNMLVLANDPILVGLFTSQSRKTGVKSSGSATENTEA